MKHVLGITGGVGCGKSTVLAVFKERYGALCLSCDDIAREMQQKGGCCYALMLDLFGEEYLNDAGEFDRAKIAKKVFADPGLLKKLNDLIHPAVKQQVAERVRSFLADGGQLAVVEAALLIEGDYGEICDEIWYIYTSEEARIDRLMASRGYSRERCLKMMKSQKNEDFFRTHTELTIDNNGKTEDLEKQIDRGLREHGFLYDSKREQR